MSPEPLVPAPHDVLASDPERERVAEALREHATAGRLDPDELDERLGAAYAARRRADLLPLLADLPAPAAPRPRARRRPAPDFAPVLVLAAALVVIWALTGAGYFWPVWPIAAVALSTVKHRRGACMGGHRAYAVGRGLASARRR
ncbi:MAG TPA: DUF1707 domain-containing protein [Gaiellaceae bacterium]|nr:DUF1707 domain-containing protein [Gaiellaceae bacterium]